MASYAIFTTDDTTISPDIGGGITLSRTGSASVSIPADYLDTSDNTAAYVAADPGTSNDSLYKWLKRFWKKVWGVS